jgi:hypothetical protein
MIERRMKKTQKHGKIAFIATPQFRATSDKTLQEFVFQNMYALCHSFKVVTTGGTYEALKSIAKLPINAGTRYGSDHRYPIKTEAALDDWRKVVRDGLNPTMDSFRGMIHVAYELVEGRLDAVIHLSDGSSAGRFSV